MAELERFAAGVISAALDPFAVIGYIVAGLVSDRIWKAAIWGLVWAVATDVFVRFIDPTGYHGQYVALRIVGGVVVATAVFVIKALIKANRGR